MSRTQLVCDDPQEKLSRRLQMVSLFTGALKREVTKDEFLRVRVPQEKPAHYITS